MAEHYAKVASSEVDDARERVRVSGPGSAEPGLLLASPSEHMTWAEAQAMAIDLARRSTPAEGGLCPYQPVVRGDACQWDQDCHNCDKFVMCGADLLYWRRKAEQWASSPRSTPTAPTRTRKPHDRKTEAGLVRIKSVVDQLAKSCGPMTVAAVARRSDVSRAFLYEHTEARTIVAEATRRARGLRAARGQGADRRT